MGPPPAWLVAIGIGQIISMTLAMTGFFSTNLAEMGFQFPVLQSTGFYLLLSLYLIGWPFPIKLPVYLYVVLALLDVEANFLAVLAYQYTDITSVLLLNSLTIPWVVLLSYFLLNKRYTLRQMAAVGVCIGGLGLVVLSDTLRGRWDTVEGEYPKAWIGDLICVGSSLLYAMQNVLQEYMLKRLGTSAFASNKEYLGMLGLCGFVISNVQWLIVEREGLVQMGSDLWTSYVIGYFIGFSFTMLTLYLLLSWYIGKYDASVFNMSILTCGVYGLLLEFAQGKSSVRSGSDWMYILAYVLIVCGVLCYSIYDPTSTVSAMKSKLERPLSSQ
jgi:solute carrier family 35, member F1/2